MNKSNLLSGSIVQLRNNDIYLVQLNSNLWDSKEDAIIQINNDCFGYLNLSDYNDDLILINNYSDDDVEFDIMRVLQLEYVGNSIKEVSNILKDKNYKIKWTWERKVRTEKEIEMEKLQEKINENLKIAKELQEQYNRLKNC